VRLGDRYSCWMWMWTCLDWMLLIMHTTTVMVVHTLNVGQVHLQVLLSNKIPEYYKVRRIMQRSLCSGCITTVWHLLKCFYNQMIT
jgi:hypothetical protein